MCLPNVKVGEEITLLKGIDGSFRPGVLTALMGASGAGKVDIVLFSLEFCLGGLLRLILLSGFFAEVVQ